MTVDRRPDQHAGYCFCRGSRVSQTVNAVTVEVALISHFPTSCNENAGDLLEIPRFDRLLHLAEALSRYANGSRATVDRPSVLVVLAIAGPEEWGKEVGES
jgi:hypothetical protein